MGKLSRLFKTKYKCCSCCQRYHGTVFPSHGILLPLCFSNEQQTAVKDFLLAKDNIYICYFLQENSKLY